MFLKQNKALFLFLAVCLLLATTAVSAMPARMTPSGGGGGIAPVVAEIGQQLQELVTGEPVAELEPQETFGTRALGLVLSTSKQIAHEVSSFVENFSVLPQLREWAESQTASPVKLQQWQDARSLMISTISLAFLARFFFDALFFAFVKRLRRKVFTSSAARFGGALMKLALYFVPVAVFLAAALYAIDLSQPAALPKFIVMTSVYALALFQLLLVVLRFLLSPKSESLRFLPISTENARYLKSWGSWYGGIFIFGTFLTQIAKNIKMPDTTITSLRSVVALLVVMMTLFIIVQKKSLVSSFIRGSLSAARYPHTLWQSLRLWFARVWHVLAIIYLVVGYFVTMMGPEDGFLTMQQGTIGTLLVLFFMRMALFMSSRLAYQKLPDQPASGLYRPVLRVILKLAIWLGGAAAIGVVWGVPVNDLVASSWGQRVLGSLFTITSTILILVAIYEAVHLFIDRKLNRRDDEGNIVKADARSRTLLPMAHNVAIFVLVVIAGLVTLSELGVDTGPLLAGAGVFGIAIGFGSQTLVKDFLTGLFILIEDTMAVGDTVKIGDNVGDIERMTIRTVKLRDSQGAVHILPFSEITRIVNYTKNFSYAVFNIEVAYDSDLDHVMKVIENVGNRLGEEPVYKDMILAPIDIKGVEELGSSSITILSRIKTRPGKQWDVRRAFLLRIKKAFDAEGIEIPFPHVVNVTPKIAIQRDSDS